MRHRRFKGTPRSPMLPGKIATRPASAIIGGVALVLGLGVVAAVLPRGPWSRPRADQATFWRVRTVTAAESRRFAGSAACAPCHAREYRTHAGSHHALAVARVTTASDGRRFLEPSGTRDPIRGLTYQTAVAGDRCILTVTENGRQSAVAASLGFGSGKHAITYLGDYGGELLELRLSHYTAARRWSFSPGQQAKQVSGGVLYPLGLVKAPEVVEGCFTCHSTSVVKEGGRIRPDRSLLGVGCESCHGPGADHIAAVRRGDRDLRMVRLSAAASRVTTEVCGQCHRSPASEDVNDSFNRSQLPRLQGLALAQSPCFTNSNGRLTCLTCHDPHTDADRPRSFYNQRCLSCHSNAAAQQRECPIQPDGDCVSCHMPEQPVGMPTHLRYRTHWIKVWGLR